MKLSIQILNHQDGLGAKIAFFQGFEIVVVFFSLATVRSFRKVGGQRNAFHNGTVLFIVAFRRKMQHQKCFQRPDRLVPSEPAIQLFPVRQPEPNSRTPRGSLGRFLAKQGPRSIEAARFLRDLSFLFILSSLFFSLRLQASLVSLPFPLLVLAQRFLVFLVLLATQLGFLFPLIPPARCLEDRSFVFLKRRGNQTRELQGSEFYQTQTLGLEDQLDRSLCDATRTRTRTGTIVVVVVAPSEHALHKSRRGFLCAPLCGGVPGHSRAETVEILETLPRTLVFRPFATGANHALKSKREQRTDDHCCKQKVLRHK
mmetsp:Transcript_32853/g.77546  ORF Transcript_32853/g.77546 Transcript_32853/m.77546 type:complete len:314 (+) Transcript_32853:344-1285(+)